MQALELLYTPTVSKTLSILSPIPKHLSPSSLSPPFLRSLSLSLPKPRLLSHCASRFPNTNQQAEEAFDKGELEDVGNEEADESDGEDLSAIDVDALEEEARDAAREYSSSLSRELIIGESGFSIPCVRFDLCV
jgi:hypothetical protein